MAYHNIEVFMLLFMFLFECLLLILEVSLSMPSKNIYIYINHLLKTFISVKLCVKIALLDSSQHLEFTFQCLELCINTSEIFS